MTHVFISYSHAEKALAGQLAEQLTEAGFDVWWDASLLGGSHFDDAIRQVIEEAPVTIVLWSKLSAQSDWVKAEANLARERKTALPVVVDDVAIVALPIPFQQLHTIDLKDWDGNPGHSGFQQIRKSIMDRLGRGAGPTLSHEEATAKLTRSADQAALWADVAKADEPQGYRQYLDRVGPDGRFVDLANVRLARSLRRSRRRSLIVAALAGVAVLGMGLTAFALRPNGQADGPSPPATDRCGDIAQVAAPVLKVSFCIDTDLWTLQTPTDPKRDVYYAAPGASFMISVTPSHFATDDMRQALIDLNQKMATTTGTVKIETERTRALDNRTWTVWEMRRPRASDVEYSLVYFYSDFAMNVELQFWNYADPSSLLLIAEPILKSLRIS